jgi:DNA-binding NtrC family response regulator
MHILLVEDDEPIRDLLATVLREAGMQVTARSNARTTLALPEDAAPDVLVADFNLAEMDGSTLAKAAQRRWPQVGVVLISGDPTLAACASAPRQRFLAKPFRLNDLLHAVQVVASSPRVDRSRVNGREVP